MKKYIRTKDDKIYCTRDLEKNEILNRKLFVHRKTKELIYSTWIKQEADTIKELCDEFVEYGNRPIVITQANVKEGRMCGKTPVILGAIWTDKGLIYVAKMNEKGELELL